MPIKGKRNVQQSKYDFVIELREDLTNADKYFKNLAL